MLSIRLTPQGKNTFRIVFNMPITTKSGIRQGFYQFGSLLHKSLREGILEKKHGNLYYVRRGKRRFAHIAAADGETPANVTGKLRRSVDFKVYGYSKMEFGYNNGVDYGVYLEFGTKKMGAKPGIKNTVEKNKLNGIKLMENEIIKRWS